MNSKGNDTKEIISQKEMEGTRTRSVVTVQFILSPIGAVVVLGVVGIIYRLLFCMLGHSLY